MKTQDNANDGLFYRLLAGVAMTVPLVLVIAAAACPDGKRGALIVVGCGALLASMAIALILRAAYHWGFTNAVRNSAVASMRRDAAEYPNQSCAM